MEAVDAVDHTKYRQPAPPLNSHHFRPVRAPQLKLFRPIKRRPRRGVSIRNRRALPENTSVRSPGTGVLAKLLSQLLFFTTFLDRQKYAGPSSGHAHRDWVCKDVAGWAPEAMSRPEHYASRILLSPLHTENSLQSVSLRSRQCQCLSMCRLAGSLFEWNRCQILWDPYMI